MKSYLPCLGITFLFMVACSELAEADDREALIGTWKITVFQDDGNDRLGRLAAGPAKKKDQEARVAKLVFTKDECYLIRGDGQREKASGLCNAGFKSVAIDESASPKTIDLIGYVGKENQKTKTYPGIYELTDNTLKICYAESGSKRPEKFESNGNDNLFVCERISKEPIPVSEEDASKEKASNKN